MTKELRPVTLMILDGHEIPAELRKLGIHSIECPVCTTEFYVKEIDGPGFYAPTNIGPCPTCERMLEVTIKEDDGKTGVQKVTPL